MEETVTISRLEYEQLKAQSAALTELQALVEQLRAEIALLKNGRNSKTSSTPPSQDIARSNTVNLRVKSGKKSGGQFGHQGQTLVMQAEADEVIEHSVDCCKGCGQSLASVAGRIDIRRQEVEIPIVQPRYIEHRSMVKTCPCC